MHVFWLVVKLKKLSLLQIRFEQIDYQLIDSSFFHNSLDHDLKNWLLLTWSTYFAYEQFVRRSCEKTLLMICTLDVLRQYAKKYANVCVMNWRTDWRLSRTLDDRLQSTKFWIRIVHDSDSVDDKTTASSTKDNDASHRRIAMCRHFCSKKWKLHVKCWITCPWFDTSRYEILRFTRRYVGNLWTKILLRQLFHDHF